MSNERSSLGGHDLVTSAAIHAGRVPNVAADEVCQTWLMSALVDGIHEGKETYGDLHSHGDFGLGTFNDLDGEMVGLTGSFISCGPMEAYELSTTISVLHLPSSPSLRMSSI